MNFSKIKYNGSRVELHWTDSDTHKEVEHKLTSFDVPAMPFVESVNAFSVFVRKILDLPEATLDAPSFMENMKVIGVSLNTENDGRRGCVITSVKKLAKAHAPLVVNTPHLRERTDDPNEGEAGFFLDGMSGAIDDLESAAEGFIGGDRAQPDLFARGDVTVTVKGTGMFAEAVRDAFEQDGVLR